MGAHHLTDETLERAKKLADEFGYDGAAKKLGITKEAVRRYVREYRRRNEESGDKVNEQLLRQVKERFSNDELRRLISTSEFDNSLRDVRHDFDGETVTFGVLTDTHLGSKYTDVEMLYTAFDEFSKAGVDFITHSGDVHEGLSTRPGHYYECSHIGYSQQLEHSREVFGQWTDTPIYMIDGNHDRWYIKSNGALICDELAKSLDNVHFLGHDEGDIHLNNVKIKLWHGEDGSSYAFSYRIQKIVESFTGGEKPNVLICGHTHKALYVLDRNIHCVSAGAMQKQSKWMRGKRAASHTGFWIVRMVVNDYEVLSFNPQFFPFYR
jgi:predicted phosphodiesterase/polyhydroxyalkanoate synthesis regulator phasin